MMVAVFGTMAADGIHDGAGIPYAVTTPFFAVVRRRSSFLVWHRSEGTLSIHTITTRRREAFYWTAVLAHLRARHRGRRPHRLLANLGFFASASSSRSCIAVPAIAWWRFDLNPVLAFWAAYVVTRPLGASFADWLRQAHATAASGWGDGTVSAIALVAFVALVGYVAVTKRDVQRRHHLYLPQPWTESPEGGVV